jgi:ubiquinone/menaquinone biosynthesis C-methylase UbiE
LQFEEARAAEVQKYIRCYRNQGYRMGQGRKSDAIRALAAIPCRGSYLDVSTGRGEMIDIAERMHFQPCMGTEAVEALCDGKRIVHALAHALPFGSGNVDVVTMFDVIEHLLPGDDERACLELRRVAKKHIIVAANNRESNNGKDDLHINKRPYPEWDRLFRQWFAPGKVISLGCRDHVSELWRIDL